MKKDKFQSLYNDLACVDDIVEFLLKSNPKLDSESTLIMSLENIQDKIWYWRALVSKELIEKQIN